MRNWWSVPLGLEAVDQGHQARRAGGADALVESRRPGARPRAGGGRRFERAARGVSIRSAVGARGGIQAAERAYLDGHRQAASAHRQLLRGQRLAKALCRRLAASRQGLVVDAQTYPLDQSDYADPVRRLLNIDQSEARNNAPSRCGSKIKLKFERVTRRRRFYFFSVPTPNTRASSSRRSITTAPRAPASVRDLACVHRPRRSGPGRRSGRHHVRRHAVDPGGRWQDPAVARDPATRLAVCAHPARPAVRTRRRCLCRHPLAQPHRRRQRGASAA